jgi:DNA repair ATPase RecN
MTVKVKVKNFQSIANSEIEIDRFTVVSGTNNSGKSALQRAIRGVFTNTPGTSFIRHGEQTMEVTLDFGEGQKVSWSKGLGSGDRPSYRLNDGPPIFPGSDVPAEVLDLGVRPVTVAGHDVWPQFAPQVSGQVFMLDRPGSHLAELVSDVDRVGQLNDALRLAEGDKRTATQTLRVRKTDLISAETDFLRYAQVDALNGALSHLDALELQTQKLSRAHSEVSRLERVWEEARTLCESLAPVATLSTPESERVSRLLQDLVQVESLLQAYGRARRESDRLSPLRSLETPESVSVVDTLRQFVELVRLEDKYRQALAAVQTMQGFPFGKDILLQDAGGIRVLLDTRNLLLRLQQDLTRFEGEVQTAQTELSAALVQVASAESEVQEVLGHMGFCPVCERS